MHAAGLFACNRQPAQGAVGFQDMKLSSTSVYSVRRRFQEIFACLERCIFSLHRSIDLRFDGFWSDVDCRPKKSL